MWTEEGKEENNKDPWILRALIGPRVADSGGFLTYQSIPNYVEWNNTFAIALML